MRAFVTGGSGFVGGHLIRRLVADGAEVVALARSDAAADRVEDLGAVSHRGDLSSAGRLAKGLEGAAVTFHCAGVVGSNVEKAEAWRVNVEGTRNVVKAARDAGVRRLVHVSTESVLHDGRPLDGVDETYPIPTRGHLSHYAASKAEAERIVLAANGDGLETIAIRPRLVWGPEDGAWLPGLVEKVDLGVFRWVDGGSHLGSTCHVYNLVEALVLAANSGKPGAVYFVTDGPPRTFREFAGAYLATAGVEVGEGSVPGWLMRAVGATLETVWRFLPTRSWPPVNRVEAYMVSHPQVFDDTLARRELGYRPVISVEEGLEELVSEAG
ncbi:MAG: NAD-dependent epimerase/dehydratase family protein [Acidimicrobiia bacterium]|nr:NAD-dependent epimerase/dehydratase family protein [Acidimicrobiia bacterium]